MSTYSVLHYCPILPYYETVKEGLSLDQAEKFAAEEKKMWLIKYPYHHCCNWYVQKE